MTKRILIAGVLLIALALKAPPATAQAQRRGGGESAPSPSSGGSGSNGGDSAPAPQPTPQPVVRRAPEGGSTGGASARPRSNPAATGSAGQSAGAGGGDSAGARSIGRQPERRYNGARERTTQGYRGVAQARVYFPPDRSPSFGYHNRTPWYFSSNPYGSPYSDYGFGYGYSYYGRSSWGGSPYGPGYGLFGYDPYGAMYAPLYLGGGFVGGGRDQDDDRPNGSIRLRAEPREAKVYVDGALVGTVDDFDGLRNHLDLQPGRHHIELRAEGYDNYSTDVSVAEGKTLTTRASMKKTKK